MRRQKRFGCKSGNTLKKCPFCSLVAYSLINKDSDLSSGSIQRDSEEIQGQKNDNWVKRKYHACNLRRKNQFGYSYRSHKYDNKTEKKYTRFYWNRKDIRIEIKETDETINLFKLQNFEHLVELDFSI